MQTRDIMSKNVAVVLPKTHLNEIARYMQQRDCGSVLVAKEGHLVGVITDRDLVVRGICEGHNFGSTKVEDVMSKEVVVCLDTDEPEALLSKMANNKVRRLPVLDEKENLVGVISLGDLAAHMEENGNCAKALGYICAVPSSQ